MTTRRLSYYLLLLFVVALSTSCRSQLGAASATISNENGTLEFGVKNSGPRDLTIDKEYALSDISGGGNLLLIPVRKGGLLYRACANIDYGPEYAEPFIVVRGAAAKSEVIETKLLKQLYCLPSGEYELSAVYFDKRGNRIHSNTIPLRML